jgi:hypothetical protein
MTAASPTPIKPTQPPIAVNGSRPASYIGHVVSNGTNFNLPVQTVGVNVRTNLTNVNLKPQPSRAMPWTTAQRNSQAVAIAQSLSPHMHAQSDSPGVHASCWPDSDRFAFVTSAADGKRDGRDKLGRGDSDTFTISNPTSFLYFLHSRVVAMIYSEFEEHMDRNTFAVLSG